MASTSDIRDIMNLGQAVPRQPAPKKKKASESQVRVTGVRREVQALMGDSVPPIAIVQQRSYKSRPSISQKLFKPRHWDERSFQHGGRSDGLVLRHWKRSIPGSNARAPIVANGSADVEMTDGAKTEQDLKFEDEYPSQKWNVKVQVPTYTDDQYESTLKSQDWTRQETDYLIHLCHDYDLRWIIIADRYTPTEIPPPSTAVPEPVEATTIDLVPKTHYPPRTMESMKQRYYSIAASLMEQITPASTMTATEFQLWEKMRTFDAKTETMRKAMAEKLFERTKDEADEERILLEELHRITKNEDDFIKMRRDLYARLEPVAPLRRSGNGEEQSTAMYQTSGGLSMLLQTLLAKEKRLKRPTLPDGTAGPSTGTPTDARAEKSRQASQYSRRDTLDTQATGDEPQKKSSVSQTHTVRILSPTDAARFGVSHPQDRLTSGVQFRHEKISRLTMAKSQTQTTKIQAALTELGIPARLLMPTERVCREFERLVGEINILLDSRKVAEKVSSEVKVLEEMRRVRLGLPKEGEEGGGDGAAGGNIGPDGFPNAIDAMEIDDSQIAETSKVDESAVPEEDEDAEAEEDDETADIAQKQTQDDESAMQVDEDDDDDDADEDASESAAAKVAEEDEDDEEEQDEGVTRIGNEDDDDDDDQEDDDDGPQLGLDEDDDEDDEEVAATPQDDSDEEAASDEGAQAEAEARARAQVEADSNDDDDEEEAEVDIDEDDSDTEAQAQAQAAAQDSDESEEEEDDQEEDADPSPAPATRAAAAAAGANGSEDEDEVEEPEPALAPAGRSHKRSASVISEASRAGSNRSGVGRKKQTIRMSARS